MRGRDTTNERSNSEAGSGSDSKKGLTKPGSSSTSDAGRKRDVPPAKGHGQDQPLAIGIDRMAHQRRKQRERELGPGTVHRTETGSDADGGLTEFQKEARGLAENISSGGGTGARGSEVVDGTDSGGKGGSGRGGHGTEDGSAVQRSPRDEGANIPIGAANDRYEKEADRIARQALAGEGSTDSPSAIGRSTAQRNAQAGNSGGGDTAPESVTETVSSGGQPLDSGVRSEMEARMGQDFGGVTVHTGPQAARSAQEIGARAYTVGTHVAFDSGEYAPGTPEGKYLLAHELAHVGQQGEEVVLQPMLTGVASKGIRAFSTAPKLFQNKNPIANMSNFSQLSSRPWFKKYWLERGMITQESFDRGKHVQELLDQSEVVSQSVPESSSGGPPMIPPGKGGPPMIPPGKGGPLMIPPGKSGPPMIPPRKGGPLMISPEKGGLPVELDPETRGGGENEGGRSGGGGGGDGGDRESMTLDDSDPLVGRLIALGLAIYSMKELYDAVNQIEDEISGVFTSLDLNNQINDGIDKGKKEFKTPYEFETKLGTFTHEIEGEIEESDGVYEVEVVNNVVLKKGRSVEKSMGSASAEGAVSGAVIFGRTSHMVINAQNKEEAKQKVKDILNDNTDMFTARGPEGVRTLDDGSSVDVGTRYSASAELEGAAQVSTLGKVSGELEAQVGADKRKDENEVPYLKPITLLEGTGKAMKGGGVPGTYTGSAGGFELGAEKGELIAALKGGEANQVQLPGFIREQLDFYSKDESASEIVPPIQLGKGDEPRTTETKQEKQNGNSPAGKPQQEEGKGTPGQQRIPFKTLPAPMIDVLGKGQSSEEVKRAVLAEIAQAGVEGIARDELFERLTRKNYDLTTVRAAIQELLDNGMIEEEGGRLKLKGA